MPAVISTNPQWCGTWTSKWCGKLNSCANSIDTSTSSGAHRQGTEWECEQTHLTIPHKVRRRHMTHNQTLLDTLCMHGAAKQINNEGDRLSSAEEQGQAHWYKVIYLFIQLHNFCLFKPFITLLPFTVYSSSYTESNFQRPTCIICKKLFLGSLKPTRTKK